MIHFKQKQNVENEIPVLIIILKLRFTKKIVFFFVKMQRKIVTSFYASHVTKHYVYMNAETELSQHDCLGRTKWVTCKEPQGGKN